MATEAPQHSCSPSPPALPAPPHTPPPTVAMAAMRRCALALAAAAAAPQCAVALAAAGPEDRRIREMAGPSVCGSAAARSAAPHSAASPRIGRVPANFRAVCPELVG